MAVTYTDDTSQLRPEMLTDFFVGWPNPPSPATHLEILCKSSKVWLAMDGERCVGFINAISDGVFYAFIPLLEVLPEYKGNRVGTELVNRMVASLQAMYAIDVVCDESVAPFYDAKGFCRCVGMIRRNYENQSGAGTGL